MKKIVIPAAILLAAASAWFYGRKPEIPAVPFAKVTRAFDRSSVPSEGGSGTGWDGRTLSYRHGVTKSNQGMGTYRLNALFFDGHAASLNEKEAMNPSLWLPKGSIIPAGAKGLKIWNDVDNFYIHGQYPFTVP